jgi:hypothetical protein
MANHNKLINVAACKAFALAWAKDRRPGWAPTRVSKQFTDDLETKVRLAIQSAITHHPSIGKTIKDFF